MSYVRAPVEAKWSIKKAHFRLGVEAKKSWGQ
jgi:hypothetical protein